MTCSAAKHTHTLSSTMQTAHWKRRAHGWRGACLVVQDTLDVELMHRASQGLVESATTATLCDKDPTKGTVRCISHASVEPLTHLHFPLLGCFDCNAPERPVALGRCNRCSAASAAAAAASATATATENFECSHAMSGVDLHDAGEPSDDIGCERAEEPSSSNHSSHWHSSCESDSAEMVSEASSASDGRDPPQSRPRRGAGRGDGHGGARGPRRATG